MTPDWIITDCIMWYMDSFGVNTGLNYMDSVLSVRDSSFWILHSSEYNQDSESGFIIIFIIMSWWEPERLKVLEISNFFTLQTVENYINLEENNLDSEFRFPDSSWLDWVFKSDLDSIRLIPDFDTDSWFKKYDCISHFTWADEL